MQPCEMAVTDLVVQDHLQERTIHLQPAVILMRALSKGTCLLGSREFCIQQYFLGSGWDLEKWPENSCFRSNFSTYTRCPDCVAEGVGFEPRAHVDSTEVADFTWRQKR